MTTALTSHDIYIYKRNDYATLKSHRTSNTFSPGPAMKSCTFSHIFPRRFFSRSPRSISGAPTRCLHHFPITHSPSIRSRFYFAASSAVSLLICAAELPAAHKLIIKSEFMLFTWWFGWKFYTLSSWEKPRVTLHRPVCSMPRRRVVACYCCFKHCILCFEIAFLFACMTWLPTQLISNTPSFKVHVEQYLYLMFAQFARIFPLCLAIIAGNKCNTNSKKIV